MTWMRGNVHKQLWGKGSPRIREQARATTKALGQELVQGIEWTIELKSDKQGGSSKSSEIRSQPYEDVNDLSIHITTLNLRFPSSKTRIPFPSQTVEKIKLNNTVYDIAWEHLKYHKSIILYYYMVIYFSIVFPIWLTRILLFQISLRRTIFKIIRLSSLSLVHECSL